MSGIFGLADPLFVILAGTSDSTAGLIFNGLELGVATKIIKQERRSGKKFFCVRPNDTFGSILRHNDSEKVISKNIALILNYLKNIMIQIGPYISSLIKVLI